VKKRQVNLPGWVFHGGGRAGEYLFHPVLICPYIGDKRLLLGPACTQGGHFRGKRVKPGVPSLQLLVFAVDQVIVRQVGELACALGDVSGYPFLSGDFLYLLTRDYGRRRDNDQDGAEQEHGENELCSQSHGFSFSE
jgi:hypothetical protein